MNRSDLVVAALFLALGVAICATSISFPDGPGRLPGPGFFPGVVGAAIATLALLLLLRAARRSAGRHVALANGRMLALTVLLLAAYLVLWGVIPFVPRTFAVLLLFLRMAGERWRPAITVSGVLTAIVSLAFHGLRVTLE